MSATRFLIRLSTALIPAKGLRKRLRHRLLKAEERAWIARTVPVVRARYARHAERCREKLSRGERLKVCFLVCDGAMFSAEPIYREMLGDARFEPFIAVAPRVSRGDAFLREMLRKTAEAVRGRYGEPRVLYDPDTGRRSALEGEADVVFTSILYDGQTLPDFTAEPMSRFALVVGIPYGYTGPLAADLRRLVFLPQLAFFWQYHLPSPATVALWSERNPLLRESLKAPGYPKMDRLAEISENAERPKTVMICPHHSLERGEVDGVALSNFIRFADFFLELPRKFPDVRFVFRPHPLLFPRLRQKKWWGEERTDEYAARMKANANVEFQEGGDYFASFAASDALIHDCGSFFAEWFYVGKPQCYLLESEAALGREFTEFGLELHKAVYHAFTERDVVEFIRRVVIGGDDPKKGARAAAAEKVCAGHPRAARQAVRLLVEGLEPPSELKAPSSGGSPRT